MDKIAQDSQYRQRMMAYSEHHGVEETANRYHVCRKTVWKWSKRWDGTAKSLEEKSRRPKSSPRKQKPWEIELVKRMRKKYGEDLLLGYQKAREKGYKRSYGCFKRTAWFYATTHHLEVRNFTNVWFHTRLEEED